MKKILIITLIMGLLYLNATEDMHVDGTLEVYNIGTYKQEGEINTLDANALAIGGQFSITSADINGWFTKVNFMTSNGLFIDNNPAHIDGSVLANDVAVVSGNPADKANSIVLMGEAYVGYESKTSRLKIGRQKYKSPLASTKEVRELPSTFSGATAVYTGETLTLGLAAFDKFKQRTSDRFYNALEHALGVKTQNYTGRRGGSLYTAKLIYKTDKSKFSLYEYYMEDFLSSLYAGFETKVGETKWELQSLYQRSIGNFDRVLKEGSSSLGIYEEGLSVSEVGARVTLGSKEDKLILATTYTGSKENAYSDIVAPFDGTPLFTDTITGNNLFKSNYGKALAADSGYTADTLSLKVAYKHKISSSVKSMLALGRFDQALGGVAQTDINVVFSWKTHGWDLAAKAIYVFDDAQNPGQKLQQYRLIATYKFHK